MPRRLKLDIELGSEIHMIAITCPRKDFWLAKHLNDLLQFDLRRMDDLPYFHPSIKEILNYVLFYYPDETTGTTCFLIGNYNPDGKLFPEYRAADFFLIINGYIAMDTYEKNVSEIKGVKGIQTAFNLDKHKPKDLKNFISDLELHMMEQIKKRNL